MPDQTAVTMVDVLKSNGPALSATSDMPVVETPVESAKTENVSRETKTETADQPKPEGEQDKPVSDQATDKAETKTATEVKPKDDTPAWAKAEITKERNRRREAEEKATSLELQLKQALELGTKPKPAEAVRTEAEKDPRPQRQTFDNPDAYDAALIEWSTRQATRIATAEIEKQRAEDDKKRAQTAQEQEQQKVFAGYQERRTALMAEHADYAEVTEAENLQISAPMSAVIVHADNGPAIAYYLGQNPKEAARIAALPTPGLQVMEMGRLSERLTHKAAAPRLPRPPTPINGSNRGGDNDGEEPSMDAYAANHPLTKRREEARARARPN